MGKSNKWTNFFLPLLLLRSGNEWVRFWFNYFYILEPLVLETLETHTHIPLFHVIKQSPNFSLPLLWKFIQLQPRTGLVIIIKCIWCGIQTQIVRGYIVEVFWNEEKVTCVCVCMSNFLLDNILNTYWYIC